MATVEKSKVPANITNFVSLWTEMKKALLDNYGAYKNPDGTPVYYEGVQRPQITLEQADRIYKSWVVAGEDAAHLDVGLFVAGKILLAIETFKYNYNNWLAWNKSTYGQQRYQNKYLFLLATHKLFDVVSRFSITLDNLLWEGFNIEGPYARMYWAFEKSAEDVLKKAKDALSLLNPFAALPKWLVPASIAGIVWWFALKTPSRKR